MSEFWVSKKKYFCKYCEIYIADDVPSRQQHENGLRHKGNKDRFIRDLYKSGDKKKKEEAEEEREMKMIEQAAQIAYAKDVGHAVASQASATSSTSKPVAAKPAVKSGNKWADYTSAADLGIADVEAELAAAEASIRQKEGRIGGWTTVSVSTPAPSEEPVAGPSTFKRIREPSPDEEDDTRRFKVRQRAAPVGLGQDVYDPGEIRIKKRDVGSALPKKEEEVDPSALIPQWQPTQWRRAGDARPEDGERNSSGGQNEGNGVWSVVKAEAPPDGQNEPALYPPSSEELLGPAEGHTGVEAEEQVDQKMVLTTAQPIADGAGLFKKRKIKSTTVGGRKPLKP